jgi:hypothetical protein
VLLLYQILAGGILKAEQFHQNQSLLCILQIAMMTENVMSTEHTFKVRLEYKIRLRAVKLYKHIPVTAQLNRVHYGAFGKNKKKIKLLSEK